MFAPAVSVTDRLERVYKTKEHDEEKISKGVSQNLNVNSGGGGDDSCKINRDEEKNVRVRGSICCLK
jgi:hypothetical protein